MPAAVSTDALGATAMRMGWIALACALVGGVTLIPAVNVVLGLLIALVLWLCTCLPAIYNGRRTLKSGVTSGMTPTVRRQANLGQILGWIATVVWVIVVVAHGI